jgi:hypothetical protein
LVERDSGERLGRGDRLEVAVGVGSCAFAVSNTSFIAATALSAIVFGSVEVPMTGVGVGVGVTVRTGVNVSVPAGRVAVGVGRGVPLG